MPIERGTKRPAWKNCLGGRHDWQLIAIAGYSGLYQALSDSAHSKYMFASVSPYTCHRSKRGSTSAASGRSTDWSRSKQQKRKRSTDMDVVLSINLEAWSPLFSSRYWRAALS